MPARSHSGHALTNTTTPPRFHILIMLAIISVIPLNMFVPSLPTIAEDFGVDYAVVNIAIGGYAVVMALTQVIGGALSDRFGRRPVALVALGIFTIASIGCIVAPNIYLFLAFRMAQGTAAACQAVALAAIRDSYDGAEMRARIGSLSSAWAFGPMVGPTVGGILASALGWRSNFVLFAVLGAIAYVLVLAGFAETNRERSTRILELRNYAGFIRSGRFWAYALMMAFGQGAVYVFLGGAPTVAEVFGNLSETHIGLFIGLVPLGFMVGSVITARTSLSIPPHHIILAGRILTTGGLATGLVLYFAGVHHPLAFFLPCMTMGMGNGLSIPSANAGVLAVAGKNAGAALGLATAIMVTGAALLSFVSGFAIQGGSVLLSSLLFMFGTSAAALVAAVVIFQGVRRHPMPR